MPYIKQKYREEVHRYGANNSGDLNFMITSLCTIYLKQHKYDYATMNEIIGALECAKHEFYRRIIVPYEDKKIKENGDVY